MTRTSILTTASRSEVMHEIVNGQPDEKMPAPRAFGMQPVIGIMAYIATLPMKKL